MAVPRTRVFLLAKPDEAFYPHSFSDGGWRSLVDTLQNSLNQIFDWVWRWLPWIEALKTIDA